MIACRTWWLSPDGQAYIAALQIVFDNVIFFGARSAYVVGGMWGVNDLNNMRGELFQNLDDANLGHAALNVYTASAIQVARTNVGMKKGLAINMAHPAYSAYQPFV
jgi:hypothetical protein